MPSETLLIVTAIVALFGLFGAALLWAEKQSATARRAQLNIEKARVAAKPRTEDGQPRKAA